MGAPANSKCEKCFNTLPPGAATCPECGAPVGDAPRSDTEAEVYPELARANLARMRGDYKQAEDVLLSVLKRFPNNPSANEMLGDLAAEREEFAHAAEWYEMALEIVPTSASITRKLNEARASIEKKEAKDTTAQLGLPDPGSRMPLIIGVAVILIVAVAAGAYYLGARGSTPPKPPPTLKVEAQRDQPPADSGAEKPAPGPEPAVAEEAELLQALKAKSTAGAAILGVTTEPRTGAMIVTFLLSGKEDRKTAATIAREALEAFAGYMTITVRGIDNGKVSYMADASRQRVAETDTDEWRQQHQNEPDAWVAYVLQNEWPNAAPSGTTPQNPPGNESPGPGAAPPTETTTSGGGQ